jgi:hypothetical protein
VRGTGWTMIGAAAALVVILVLQAAFRRQWTVAEDLGPILNESIAEDTDNENVFQAGLWIRIDLIRIRIQHFCSIRIQFRIRIQAKTELSKTISFSNFFEIKI